jgi:tetratricopeptide (TPR) repeat protein
MILRVLILIIFSLAQNGAFAQYALFDNPENIRLVKKGAHFIYNQQPDAAQVIIEQVGMRLPGHPVVPMMKALAIGWSVFPMKTSLPEFEEHERLLHSTIEAAEQLLDKDNNHVEGIFFQMSARGLLAEYYADDGNYVKALGEARKTYGLLKAGFDLVDEYPEFYLTTGLYNYFREKYPQRHPIYKPFLWFFRGGDIEMGLEQIRTATQKAVLSNAEAHLYLSYIYLRYEMQPEKAEEYLLQLNEEYPNNQYFKAKLLECYIMFDQFELAEPIAERFLDAKDPYYLLLGQSMKGYLLEKWIKAKEPATRFYNDALTTGKLTNKGSYYEAIAYLGLGRIDFHNNRKEAAKRNFEIAMTLNDNDMIEQEAKKYLKQL